MAKYELTDHEAKLVREELIKGLELYSDMSRRYSEEGNSALAELYGEKANAIDQIIDKLETDD